MHRVESTDHENNLFTEGPPATRLGEDWPNSVQEELCYLIETLGTTILTADTDTRTQLYDVLVSTAFLTAHGLTASIAELNHLDGITSSAAELNKLDGTDAIATDFDKLHDVTSSAAELNKLDGTDATTSDFDKLHDVTSSAAELNKLDSTDAVVADFNKLHDMSATAAEINTICDGVLIPQRAKFIHKDDDSIYLNGGVYIHRGTTNQIVYWDSQLTFQFQNLGTSDWSYLYLDDSAIVTAATNVISASELIDSVTEPAWSDAKKGWYNGEDRCIFAVLTDGDDDILEFFHDGDVCVFADNIQNYHEDLDDSWVDVTMSAPKFTTKVSALFSANWADGGGSVSWRTNGQTGATGHLMAYADGDVIIGRASSDVITDDSGIIEIIMSASNANNSYVFTIGWYFSIGM